MNESRLTLKHPSGFFAAGCEMRDALALLSDGAFKIFVYVCLHADRRTAQLRFRMAELAQATGHSTRSLTTYLDELRRTEVAVVYRAANQPRTRADGDLRSLLALPEAGGRLPARSRTSAVCHTRSRLFSGCVRSMFSAADEKLAAEWYRAGVPLDQVQRAILMGCARKYVALFNHPGGSPITCLQYFAGIVEELATLEMSLDYWRYLTARIRKMESQWRAQANLAWATPAPNPETN
jgi:hypothetical protein